MSSMTLYSNAVAVIREVAEAKRRELEEALYIRRAFFSAATQEACQAQGTEWKPIGDLVAHTITLVRADGYPDFILPASTKKIIVSAMKAGIENSSGLKFYPDASGVCGMSPKVAEAREATYQAWTALNDFTSKQDWSSL